MNKVERDVYYDLVPADGYGFSLGPFRSMDEAYGFFDKNIVDGKAYNLVATTAVSEVVAQLKNKKTR
jgi:hypothetical protein